MYMTSNYSESEDDTAEKEFGAVGDKEEKKEEEGLDRNMWAPEEDEEPNEVTPLLHVSLINVLYNVGRA